MIELYPSKAEADAARDAKPAEPEKEFYVKRVESGHWAVYWRWSKRYSSVVINWRDWSQVCERHS